jgi:hypothetical protein
VVKKVVCEDAGQLATLDGQAVTVEVRVVRIVDVVNSGAEELPET